MIPKRTKDTDISRDIAAGKELKEKISALATEAANKFLKGENLNVAVADIADREGFNRLQIQRLIEETNTISYNKKYETVKKANDRRISFELADLRKVLDQMGSSAPSEIDNPNEVKGRPGDGEIKKEASYASLHRPHKNVDVLRERAISKTASVQANVVQKESARIAKEYASDIFKIANSLVMSQRLYKNASEVLDSITSDVELASEVVEDIEKKATEIAELMVSTNRLHSSFQLNLSRNKTAEFFLGDHSLLKVGSATNKINAPKVASTQGVSSYDELLKVAKRIVNYDERLKALYE